MKEKMVEVVHELVQAAVEQECYKREDMERLGYYGKRVEHTASIMATAWARIHEMLQEGGDMREELAARSRLVINENFVIEFVKPMPGWWHRFWYKLLLGW